MRPDTTLFLNSKLAHKLPVIPIREPGSTEWTMTNALSGKDSNVMTYVRLTAPPGVKPVDRWQSLVLSAALTLIHDGRDGFTTTELARVVTGNHDQTKNVTVKRKEAVESAIGNLSLIRCEIDCTGEFRARGLIGKEQSARYDGRLLQVDAGIVRQGNGKLVSGWICGGGGPLWEYTSAVRQIVTVPTALLETAGLFSDTDDSIALKSMIVIRTAAIRTSGTKMSNTIAYSRMDGREEKGIFPEFGCGVTQEARYSSIPHLCKRRRQIDDMVTAYLDYLSGQTDVHGRQWIAGYLPKTEATDRKSVAAARAERLRRGVTVTAPEKKARNKKARTRKAEQ